MKGEAFERANDELRQMEEGKKQAIAAALGEYNKSKSKDLGNQIAADFWKDSREVTDAKIEAMREAGLDTTEVEKQVAVMRQQDAALKAQRLAQMSSGQDTQTQYIAQFGKVYENMVGSQAPRNASLWDNITGNLYADEGKGNYVSYNVGGSALEYDASIAAGGSTGYTYALNSSARNNGSETYSEPLQANFNGLFGLMWSTWADRAAIESGESSLQKDFNKEYEFSMLKGDYNMDFNTSQIGTWDGNSSMPVISNGSFNRTAYEFGAVFGMDPLYDKEVIQMNADLISMFIAGSGSMKALNATSSAILNATSKALPFVKNSVSAEMAINGVVGGVSSMTTNALVNKDVDFFSLSNLKTGGIGFLNSSLSTKYNSFGGLFTTGLLTTAANEVVSGNKDFGSISAKSIVGAGMNMFFGKGLKYQIAPYEGGKALAGFQKYVFPATVAGWYEMSNELIFNEIDKKKK